MASASVQSIFSANVQRVATHTRSSTNLILPSLSFPRQSRTSSLRVRCVAPEEKNQPEQPTPVTSSTPTPPPTPPQVASPPPRPVLKMSTKFGDLFAFSGPAPERINGRLAMIGFVAAMGVELARGTDVAAQLADGGLPWFVITSVILSVASFIPLSQGVSVESKSKGLMTSSAEMWNGRLAMLGLVALVITEAAKGGALI
ncbi:hypothetical protein MKW94_012733 [Papaver nudicaule]|uniref:Early light-induced protein n=1 Tax=Papaver nudicaule TaxID=74823 RepID=A0AA41VWS9_PAPNU|nr:hypothetical protein [Papaver nudicaule]